MCPPAPVPPPADIGLYWSDEELCTSLDKVVHGSPLPGNVIADVNPYHYKPSNLPDGIWYFIRSDEKKETELGFWKAKGEACEIFANSAITGWRTTLEFYEGQAPHGRRTDWVMQEYRITQKGPCNNSKPKDSRSLCRAFLSDGQSQNHEMHTKHGGAGIAGGNHFHSMPSTVPNAGSTTGQGSTSESQGKNRNDETGPLAVAERLPDPPVENLPDFILRGDYLELDDLADPESPSSSSDNSSCLSLTSDECFDSLALLRDLEDDNQDQQGKDASFKYNFSASVEPNEVVMHPATLGSLISGNGSKSPSKGILEPDYSVTGSAAVKGKFLDKRVLEHASRSQKAVHKTEGTSNSLLVAVSSSSHKAVLEGEKAALVGRMKRLKKKYLCFMPF